MIITSFLETLHSIKTVALEGMQIVLRSVILNPLENLYFGGPTVLGVGFWEQLPKKDICSRLTGVSATFWQGPSAITECEELIDRKYQTFLTGCFTATYIWLLYRIISYTLYRIFVLKPLAVELKEELKLIMKPESIQKRRVKSV